MNTDKGRMTRGKKDFLATELPPPEASCDPAQTIGWKPQSGFPYIQGASSWNVSSGEMLKVLLTEFFHKQCILLGGGTPKQK